MSTKDEDITRYENIDTETLRGLFTDTNLYNAWLDNIGVIRGQPDLDISNLTPPYYDE